MENLDFEFIDRAISMIKEGYNEQAAKLVYEESDAVTLSEARVFVSMLYQMVGE